MSAEEQKPSVLVEVSELRRMIPIDPSETLIVDVGSEERYKRGHIPGAVLVTPNEIMAGTPPARGKLPTDLQLQQLCVRLGLRSGLRVICYDDEGGGWAGRFLWTLEIIGYEQCACLDGGFMAWQKEGLPVASQVSQLVADGPPWELRMRPELRIEMGELRRRLNDSDLAVWDTRTAEEYAGTKQSAARNGHIPGAIHLDWNELKDFDRGLRLRSDLREFLQSRGLGPDKEIVPYCHTHHRSGLAYLACRALGYPRVRPYDGSWGEWGNVQHTPVAT